MADRLTPENRLDWLNTIQRYFDGELSPQELATFNAALQDSSALRRLFLQYSQQSSAILEVIGVRSYGSTQWVGSTAKQEDELGWITQYDQQSRGELRGLRARATGLDKNAITAREFLSLAGYVLGQGVTSKPAYKIYGIAAALAVAVTLFLVLSAGDEKPADPLAGKQPVDRATDDALPGDVGATAPIAVASLTAEFGAVWDRRPGQELYAGQRFTLTQGFAEMKTQRGAVVILEAPATVELIDRPNAIRLYAGKLVAICEAESSKGFLVHAPHTDVTDLGTCFGVDASDPSVTEVHVFDGLVAVASQISRGGASQPVELKSGDAIRIGAGQVVKERFIARHDVFESLTPRAWSALPGTGKDLAIEQVDPAWQVVSVNGQRLETPGQLRVSDVPRDFRDRLIPNDPRSSQWIRSNGVYPQASGQGDVYTVGHSFDLPEGIGPGVAWLRVRFDADDRLTQVRINGKAYTPPVNSIGDENSGLAEMTIPVTLLREGNSAEFDVLDVVRDGGTTWFFRMDWAIQQGVTISIGPPD